VGPTEGTNAQPLVADPTSTKESRLVVKVCGEEGGEERDGEWRVEGRREDKEVVVSGESKGEEKMKR
jgi:hypothetical protein